MWFYSALGALLCWSGSDVFSKLGSRPEDKRSHWKMIMAVGVVMGLHAGYSMLFGGVVVTARDILFYLPASLLYILSMIFGYAGLRYIELSVSSPLCNASGAVAALLCFLFLGQRLNAPQGIAVGLVCAGVIGLGIVDSREDQALKRLRREPQNVKYSRSLLALALPLLYCVIDALGTFVDAFLLETLEESTANTAYELTFFAMGVCAFVYVVIIKKEGVIPRAAAPRIVAGVLETAGQVAYVYAIAANAVAAAPMISAYCAASVLWGRIFLREKLTWKHYAAIGVTVAGIVVLGVYGD